MTYSTCRPIEGGQPKCGLGCIRKNHTIEVRGMPFEQFNNASHSTIKRGLALGRTYDVVILLEGVSEEEDMINMPLAGSLAQRLNGCIMQAGFASSEVYITNMVKCAPPKGRKPSTKEIKACLDHFRFELEKAQPKIILLVGSGAMRAFNLHNEGGIYKNRGQIFNVKYPGWEDGPTFKVIPTFHPSMFYYKKDPIAEQRMQDDYILAAKIAKGEKVKKKNTRHPYRLIKTVKQFDQMISEIHETNFVAFDTESTGLKTRSDPMTAMSFCWGYDNDNPGLQTAVLPISRLRGLPDQLGSYRESFWNQNSLEYIFGILQENLFENENIAKAAHNIGYDWRVIRQWCKSELKGTLYDSLLMSHLLREQKPHDLGFLSDLEFAIGNYYDKLEAIGHGLGYGRIPDHMLWPYAALDAENVYRLACLYNTRFLMRIIDTKIPNKQIFSLYTDRTMPAIEAAMEAEWDGIKMDRQKTIQYKNEYLKEQDKLLSQIKQQTNNPEFNPLSVKDVKEAAIKIGFASVIEDNSKATGYTTDKKVLFELAKSWPVASHILQYRTNRKMISTYLESALAELDSNDRIHKSFLIHGTESGRWSCSFLHQIPKATRSGLRNLRDLFIAEDGYEFCYMDYKQIEMKVYAVLIYQLTGSDALMKIFFDPKVDAHKKMASILLDYPESSISALNRDLGKTFNFGALFGSAGLDLVGKEWEDLDGKKHLMDWDMVNNGLTRFHYMYPEVRIYAGMVPDIARSQGNTYINVFGRERHIGDVLNQRRASWKISAAERELVNFTVQSVASQITVDTMVKIYQTFKHFIISGELKKKNIRFVNTVHDSLMIEQRTELRNWVVNLVKNISERPIPELANQIFTVDIGIGKTWAQAEAKENKVNVV